ncbi:hypothetical protein NKR23_g9770 [Pleurostoma richardsiae]|uniref:Uncharacterized protein n=1 Tax=Pleurostoma richardsiae TaxID=41990 RepID=A0AA38RM54_9PEZI|nr:hypothetical protein NKR23_g9770 [Pleurostoma richardsiae]
MPDSKIAPEEAAVALVPKRNPSTKRSRDDDEPPRGGRKKKRKGSVDRRPQSLEKARRTLRDARDQLAIEANVYERLIEALDDQLAAYDDRAERSRRVARELIGVMTNALLQHLTAHHQQVMAPAGV